jgi:CheY-like chemotaxis protein
VRFPAVEPKHIRVVPRAKRPAAAARRILIIEDNDDAREMLRETLAHTGHEVADARDGTSGLELAARTAPEVALIDIGLPDMDGYEVAREIRRRLPGTKPRLIAMTGYGQASDRAAAFEAGFDAHIVKPASADKILRALYGTEEA